VVVGPAVVVVTLDVVVVAGTVVVVAGTVVVVAGADVVVAGTIVVVSCRTAAELGACPIQNEATGPRASPRSRSTAGPERRGRFMAAA
jgi:hypothetical protein